MEKNAYFITFYNILLNTLMPTRSTYFARHFLRITSIELDGITKKIFLCVTQVTKLSASLSKNTRVMRCTVALLFKKTCYGIYFSFNGLSHVYHFSHFCVITTTLCILTLPKEHVIVKPW